MNGHEAARAELPGGVPQGESGPRWMAFAVLVIAFYRQSKRRTAELLDMLFIHWGQSSVFGWYDTARKPMTVPYSPLVGSPLA